MATVGDFLLAVEDLAPPEAAFSFDKVGLQVGDPLREVKGAIVCLDCSERVLGELGAIGANLVVAHHPLIWDPLTRLVESEDRTRLIAGLIRHKASFIAAHTNWDCAPDGLNDALAERLGLKDVIPFGSGKSVRFYKLVTFVPGDHLQALIDALARAGAGQIGDYTRCAYYAPGTGTFLGGQGSNPAVGEPGKVEEVAESRLEMVVDQSDLSRATAALRRAHPYEEPAYDVIPMHESARWRIGRVGELAEPMRFHAFVAWISETLGTDCLAWGENARHVRKIAVVGGSGDEEWAAAQEAGADVLVTGEVRHHNALACSEAGFRIVQAGHYATEQPGVETLAARLQEAFPAVPVRAFAPPPGSAGRPIRNG